MHRLKAAGRVAALAVALPLTGCASMGGYELGPNGLPRLEDGFRRVLAFEPEAAYRSVLDGSGVTPGDELLRLLYAGIAGRYAGAQHESSRLLDLAGYVADDRVTLRVSREALSLITSDRALPYVPGRTERLMIPYLAALNYLDAGDLGGAAVEARRMEALLDRFDDGTDPAERPESSRFLHYFAACVFQAAGDRNAAEVAFRRSGELGEELGSPWPQDGTPRPDSLGEVLVLVERGFVPHRVEQGVTILLPPTQATALTDGSVGEKAAAALETAARILTVAAHVYGDRSGYYRDPGYRSSVHLAPWSSDDCRNTLDGRGRGTRARCEATDPGGSYLLSVAWPVLYQDPLPPEPVRIRAGERAVDALAHLDVGRGVRADFEDRRATILARTVLRAATKLALATTVEDAVAEKDETAGELVGLMANISGLLTERADTRGWHLLPGAVSLARLRLPPGRHELSLETASGAGGFLALGPVEVRAGETVFLSARIWR